MNVYMLNSGYEGCNYVRIMLPAFHNGFNARKSSLMALGRSPKEIQMSLAHADIVVFHRPEDKEYIDLMKILKEQGKKIVVDNDDTFKIDDNHKLAQFTSDAISIKLEDRNRNMDNMLLHADLVTTSTEFLAKEYRKINKNVVVLPNCIDPLDWDEPLKNEGDKIRIGMVGSVSYEYDYLHMKDILRELNNRDDVQLVLFGLGDAEHRKKNPSVTRVFQDEYDFWDSLNVEQIPWCPIYEYQEKLNEARLDMMLIPRKDNYFNRCKSNIKFLEASMLEIPCIMQSFEDSPYEEITPDIGVLIKDNKDWIKEINRLVDDKELRRKLGKSANKYTLNNFNIEDRYKVWESAYQKLL